MSPADTVTYGSYANLRRPKAGQAEDLRPDFPGRANPPYDVLRKHLGQRRDITSLKGFERALHDLKVRMAVHRRILVRQVQARHERLEARIGTDRVKRRYDVRKRDEAGPLIERLGEPLKSALLVSQRDISDRHLLKVDRPSSLGETVQDPERLVAPPQLCVRVGEVRRVAEYMSPIHESDGTRS